VAQYIPNRKEIDQEEARLTDHDMRFFAKQDDLPKLATVPEARIAAGWSEDDVLLDSSTTVRRMRDRHQSFSTLAPLSIFPLPTDQLTDLMHGWLNFTTVLNVSLLARSMADYGTHAEAIGLPQAEDTFLKVLHPTVLPRL